MRRRLTWVVRSDSKPYQLPDNAPHLRHIRTGHLGLARIRRGDALRQLAPPPKGRPSLDNRACPVPHTPLCSYRNDRPQPNGCNHHPVRSEAVSRAVTAAPLDGAQPSLRRTLWPTRLSHGATARLHPAAGGETSTVQRKAGRATFALKYPSHPVRGEHVEPYERDDCGRSRHRSRTSTSSA